MYYKKVIISGSAKLQDKVLFWVDYFQNMGYEVIDYPRYIEKFDDYEKIHTDYYCNLEKTDVFFLMNEDKNNISGYIGPSAFAELMYTIIQKLIYNKDIDIYILKMPSRELNCYTEVKMWLDKGIIKIWNKYN